MPEKTVEAWRNLWFHTGDRVVRDADGWFAFIDRLKDAIRRRGENISSFEVEQALLEPPGGRRGRGLPGGRRSWRRTRSRPRSSCAEGHDADPVALIRHCEPRLAYFAIPRYLRFVEELPLTENGKVRKTVLRDAGVTDDMWDREAAGVTLRRLGR